MAEPVLINDTSRPGMAAAVRELWQYRELVVELSKRSLQLRYKNSVLGVLWSLITPLMLILLITLMTKRLMNQDIPNYSAYLFPVMFAWTFFTMAIPDMCTTLLENASLIRKVYFPRELLPITVLLSNLIHLLIAMSLALGYLILLRIVPQQVNAEVFLLLLIIPAQSTIILGMGLVLSALNTLFEDIKYLVTVTMQLMLYAVPIIYPIEKVAAAAQQPWDNPFLNHWVRPYLLELYLLNPFASVIVLYQKALLPPIQGAGHPALPWSWGLLAQVWLVALATLTFGLWVFNRAKWQAVERL